MFIYVLGENVFIFVNVSFEFMFVEEIVWVDNVIRDVVFVVCDEDVVCLFDVVFINDVFIGINSKEVNV